MMEQRQGGEKAADSHQQISVRHGLDESTGGVLAEQRGAVEHEYHHQVTRNNKNSQEKDDRDFKEAGSENLGIAYLK